jgi:hypothetical protein
MSLRTIFVSSLLLLCITLSPALAGDPNVVFKGKIMTSTKRYPLSAKSKDAYISAIKKQSATNFQEDKEKGQWKIYFAAFLSVPLNDVEYMIKFYDITGGHQQLLGASEAFNDSRGQKTIVSSIVLEKKSFGVNKQLMMTIENRGKVLASGRFKILGEGEKFTGKVNFSDEETKGGGTDE